MKIKDLDPKTNMGTVKVQTPEGIEGWWTSQWSKGVWLTEKPPDEKGVAKLIPIFINDLTEPLEWEVIATTNSVESSRAENYPGPPFNP